jgi:thiol:disulfide interchange protein
MVRNLVRSILGLVLVAAATWLANYITEQLFGPEDGESTA